MELAWECDGELIVEAFISQCFCNSYTNRGVRGGYTFCTTFLPILIIRQLSSLQDTALSQYQTLPLFARYIYTSNLCAKIVSIAQNQGDCICEILDCLNHNENNFFFFFVFVLIFEDLFSIISIFWNINEWVIYLLKIIKNVH